MKMPAEHIREEILKKGAISFARFMELALYCPETGYYEKKRDNVGRDGDFITSVSVGSLFGELLAFQFAAWLSELKTGPERLKIIEAGAHDGKLAADILNWLKNRRPDLLAELEYYFVEPSPHRRQWQREKLQDFKNIHWAGGLEELSGSTGILFSNELLDALPVHRLGWSATGKKWFEWGVALEGENLIWSQMALREETDITGHAQGISLPPSIRSLPPALLEVLPDNYTIEISTAAENWWRVAAKTLAHGKLLAIDYGFTAADVFSPSRPRGTLRAYSRHHVSDDLLANPGEQDLTAHVNFTAIQEAGESQGLHTETFCTQPQFLTRILAEATKMNSLANSPGDWNAKQIRQFQTLTHPEHLGRAFRVLVQGR